MEKFKKGDVVLVKGMFSNNDWVEKVFVGEDSSNLYRYKCVGVEYQNEVIRGLDLATLGYEEIRPIEEKHSEYYYEKNRNLDTVSEEEVMDLLSSKIPNYYKGLYGYEARKVISAFNLSYNVGTATTYLLRAGKKREQGMTDLEKHIEDLEKAKNHLDFEIERLRLV